MPDPGGSRELASVHPTRDDVSQMSPLPRCPRLPQGQHGNAPLAKPSLSGQTEERDFSGRSSDGSSVTSSITVALIIKVTRF